MIGRPVVSIVLKNGCAPTAGRAVSGGRSRSTTICPEGSARSTVAHVLWRDSTRLAQFRKTAERIAWSRGVLDGAIKTKGFFQFITEDNRVFSGAVAKAVLEQLRDFYDRECEALITTTEVTDAATGEVKTAHRLEKLRHAGEAVAQAA